MLISHVIYDVIILRKIVNCWPVGGRFKKRNRAIPSLLFILNISNTSRLERQSRTTSRKIMSKTTFSMSKFNLQLLKTWILNFAHIHSKGRKLGMFILFQSEFPTNSPISHGFPTNWQISVFKRSDTRTPQDLLWGKKCFVLGLLARDIANHSFEHTFDPGLKHLEWKID